MMDNDHFDAESTDSFEGDGDGLERDHHVSSSAASKEVDHDDDEDFANKETAAIFRLRLLFVVVLLLAAAGVSVGMFFALARSEQKAFEAQFDAFSSKVVDSFNEIVGQKLAAIGSFANWYTAYSLAHSRKWPFVAMEDYQQRVDNARRVSGSLFVHIAPTVTRDQLLEWDVFSVNNSAWITDGLMFQEAKGFGFANRSSSTPRPANDDGTLNYEVGPSGRDVLMDQIFRAGVTSSLPVDGPGPFYPIWEQSPVLPSIDNGVNFDCASDPNYAPFIDLLVRTGDATVGRFLKSAPGTIDSTDAISNHLALLLSLAEGRVVQYAGDPFSIMFLPVFDSFDSGRNVVAVLVAQFSWAVYFSDILPPHTEALDVVLSNTCDSPYTFRIEGYDVSYLGDGDLHDHRFNEYVRKAHFANIAESKVVDSLGVPLRQDICAYYMEIYPTEAFYDEYKTNLPIIIAAAVVLIFIFALAMFILYNRLVERRQLMVMTRAVQSSAIVSSMFPRQVHDRLLAHATEERNLIGTGSKIRSFLAGEQHLKDADIATDGVLYKAKPIADLFPNTTILFADIVNFTAWSSVREPSQVFTLLETVYKAFDDIAHKRRVFKVETVGDCYVAVAGLPDNRKDHALAIARFARQCMTTMSIVTRRLEVILGPDTADLTLRIGIHTGPVTAGVLRGERARFQLFGDTMNTASRMESTGKSGQIQVSSETAAALIGFGKEKWLVPRSERVNIKGKGEMKTFWLLLPGGGSSDSRSDGPSTLTQVGVLDDTPSRDMLSGDPVSAKPQFLSLLSIKSSAARTGRLVAWNVDVLHQLLRQIVARRNATRRPITQAVGTAPTLIGTGKGIPVDEVCEIITLPHFDPQAASRQEDPDSVVLDKNVIEQLEDFVMNVAHLYRDNPFHNFEHASHVVMSVVKLLARIVAPSEMDFENDQQASSVLHDHTYGITSDPLTQFACIVSALIHDVDHTGVPNAQLAKENEAMAHFYKGKSIAEQNSVDVAWSLFLDNKYSDLRSTICASDDEMSRFRQLVVNSVIATDIMDKDLKALRNARWEKAFKEDSIEGTTDAVNRKATIVIEHLIQASDVAHTMQHWHVYRKWNQRLFAEMYKAYLAGRSETDPSEFWYRGEIGFFDYYIIPLANKLKDCGVFGVSSDEYLNYAEQNRQEWELRGKEVIEEMKAEINHQSEENAASA